MGDNAQWKIDDVTVTMVIERHALADLDAELASATRRRLIDQFADAGVLLIGTHFPPPSAGHLVTEDGAVRFSPASNGGL